MKRSGRNGAYVLKTYGKRPRKVEAWLSPDIRKITFSSMSSSDVSIGEPVSLKSGRKRKKMVSTASSKPIRAAKKRALKCLRENDSDEENVFSPKPGQGIRPDRKRRGALSVKAFPKRKEWKQLETTSESEVETVEKSQTADCGSGEPRGCARMESDRGLKSGSTVALPPHLGRFVTNRRKGPSENSKAPQPKRVKTKPSASVYVSDRSLNSSDDFAQSLRRPARLADRRKKRPARDRELRSENASSEVVRPTSNLVRKRNFLKEATLNRTADRLLESGHKKPLLCSTPSLASRACYRQHEPSVSEISCSNDELEDAFKSSMEATRNLASPRQRELRVLQQRSLKMEANLGGQNEVTIDQYSKELFSPIDSKVDGENRVEKMENSSFLENVSAQSSRDCNFVSAQTHLDLLAALSKERCTATVILNKSDVSKHFLSKGYKPGEETYSSCLDSESALKGRQSGDKPGAGLIVLRGSEASEVDDVGQSPQNDEHRGAGSRSAKYEEGTSVVFISSSDPLEYDRRELPGETELGSLGTCDARRPDPNLSTSVSPDGHSEDVRLELSETERRDRRGENLSATPSCERSSHWPQGPLLEGHPMTSSLEAHLKKQCIMLQPRVLLNGYLVSKWIQASKNLLEPLGYDSARLPSEATGSESRRCSSGGGEPPEQSAGLSPRTSREAKLEGSHGNGKERLRRRLSTTFAPSRTKMAGTLSDVDLSPAGKKGANRARNQVASKDKVGTGRKACISGLSMSRWTKNDFHRQRKCPTQSLLSRTGDCSLFDFQLGLDGKKYPDTTNGCQQGTDKVFLGTPLRQEALSISSILANFTPESLTTHTWSRLKAALSVHKKKKAFFTPKKLNLSLHESLDVSTELRDLPLCTPLSRHLRSGLMGSVAATPLSPSLFGEDITDAEKLYQECQQDGPVSFEQCIPPHRMKRCKKVGEGTFGEVFVTPNDSDETVALKIVPIEGSQKVNGEDQKTFGEILHEVIISKELSSLDVKENNQTNGFIGLKDLHCVRGPYPKLLLSAWDKFDKQRSSENDRPDFFEEDQLFLILEFEFGGSDLESMNGKLASLAFAKSILHQVTVALAVAEQALCFEHRDLHWGNVLVKTTKEKTETYVLNGARFCMETKGVHVNIIDYSLSRLEIDGLTVSCDISADEELFMGKGDYQFEIYRKMRDENNNSWSEFNPHTNVLWLHYLTEKLLHMSYKNSVQTKPMKELKKSFTKFQSEVLGYKSATNVLAYCSLFQKA